MHTLENSDEGMVIRASRKVCEIQRDDTVQRVVALTLGLVDQIESICVI